MVMEITTFLFFEKSLACINTYYYTKRARK